MRAFRELFVYALKWHREEKLLEKKVVREKSRKPQAKPPLERIVARKEPEKTSKA